MDPKEYEERLVAIERMVETLGLEYRRGNHFRILGESEKTAQELGGLKKEVRAIAPTS